eukprot:3039820-Rhodomonas_salina.1
MKPAGPSRRQKAKPTVPPALMRVTTLSRAEERKRDSQTQDVHTWNKKLEELWKQRNDALDTFARQTQHSRPLMPYNIAEKRLQKHVDTRGKVTVPVRNTVLFAAGGDEHPCGVSYALMLSGIPLSALDRATGDKRKHYEEKMAAEEKASRYVFSTEQQARIDKVNQGLH